MASPAVVAAQVNGVAPLSRPDSPASSINSSTKRKRESSDDYNDPDLDRAGPPKLPVNGVHASQDRKSLVRDFFDVLQRYARLRCQPLCCAGLSIASAATYPLPSIPVLTSSTLVTTQTVHPFSSALFQTRSLMASHLRNGQSRRMANPLPSQTR